MRQWSKGSLLAAAGVGLLWAARRAVRGWRADDLRDKLVLITGGSRGLGLVLAHELLRQGARVAICAGDELELERAWTSDPSRPPARRGVRCHRQGAGRGYGARGGIGTARIRGRDSYSKLSPSWLTTLSDKAAQRNNELS